jgi:hypothetical protein
VFPSWRDGSLRNSHRKEEHRRNPERLLISLGGNPHVRHTDLYRQQVRPYEYKCLMGPGHDNIECRVSIILAAPFVAKFNDAWLS